MAKQVKKAPARPKYVNRGACKVVYKGGVKCNGDHADDVHDMPPESYDVPPESYDVPPKAQVYWCVLVSSVHPSGFDLVTYIERGEFGPLQIRSREEARQAAREWRSVGCTARVVKIPANRLEATK